MDSTLTHKIHTEQVKRLYHNFGVIIPGNLFVGLMVVVMAWGKSDRLYLGLWYLLMLAVLSWRYYDSRQFAQRMITETPAPNQWERHFTLGSGLTGALWGVVFWLAFLPEHPQLILFVVCIYAGLMSAGGATSSARMPAFIAFALPASIPIIVSMIRAGSFTYVFMGMICFVFMLTSMVVAAMHSRTTRESIRLRFENLDLITSLGQEKERAETNQAIAEQAVVAKDKFLAAASHDLRQPLHAQSLYLDAIEPHVKTTGQTALEALRKTNEALANLFNSLLDVSRLNAGSIDIQRGHLHLHDMAQALYEEHQPRAAEKGLQLHCDCPPLTVHTDPILLERIVRNLLSNAIRYTSAGSVALTCRQQDADTVSITVSDTGVGIPKEELDNIFAEYYQLNNAERDRNKGLGLGLSIVKKLCDLLDIELACKSEPGNGSTFTLSVLAGDARLVNPAANQPAPIVQLHKTVLVVDDEQDILSGTEFLLKEWGCTVVTGESAAELLAKLRQHPVTPDLILADYRLRDNLTGVGAVADIRAFYGKPVPAVIITGDTSPAILQEVRDSGLFLMHKPIAPAKLRTAMHQMAAFTEA